MSASGRQAADDPLATRPAAGERIIDAAASVGLNERTVRRRLADPAFRKKAADLRAQAVAEGVAKLGAAMAGAATVLSDLLRSTDDRVWLSAAEKIINLTIRAREAEVWEREIADLAARMEAIEKAGNLGGRRIGAAEDCGGGRSG